MSASTALAGVALEAMATTTMERRLGELAQPYHEGRAGWFSRTAKGLTGAGTAVILTAGRSRRPAAALGSALVLAGQVLARWAVFRAGHQWAEDPRHTVRLQRRRLDDRGT